MMSRQYKNWLVVAGIFLMLFVTMGQDQQQRAEGRRGRGNFNREEMRQRFEGWIKENLKISDEEWTVIGPRLERVSTLNREIQTRGIRMFGRRGGETPDEGVEQTPIQKASTELQTLLEQESPDAAEIQAKLTAFRTAKQQARQELIAAQMELKELLTLEQEAKLVMMGMLE